MELSRLAAVAELLLALWAGKWSRGPATLKLLFSANRVAWEESPEESSLCPSVAQPSESLE